MYFFLLSYMLHVLPTSSYSFNYCINN
jgi:hypothetical protein